MDPLEVEFFKENKLVYEKMIGEGAFGKIFLVYSSQYEEFFALKKIPQVMFNQGEIECLKHICQKNIINLYNYFHFRDHVYLLMEYCPRDLNYFIKQSEDINPFTLKRHIHDILQAIKACHDRNIAHQDIKPNNFLLDKYGRIKICDFGLSTIYNDNPISKSAKGTFLFMAPELFKKHAYNPIKSDIWALGITFYLMATKSFPFYSVNRLTFIGLINTGMFSDYKISDPMLTAVIKKCLDPNPGTRASADELLAMPYFEEFKLLPRQESRGNLKTKSSGAIIMKPGYKMNPHKLQDRNTTPLMRSSIPMALRKMSQTCEKFF